MKLVVRDLESQVGGVLDEKANVNYTYTRYFHNSTVYLSLLMFYLVCTFYNVTKYCVMYAVLPESIVRL